MSAGYNLGTLYVSVSWRGRRWWWEVSATNDQTIFTNGMAKTEAEAYKYALKAAPMILRLIEQAKVDKK